MSTEQTEVTKLYEVQEVTETQLLVSSYFAIYKKFKELEIPSQQKRLDDIIKKIRAVAKESDKDLPVNFSDLEGNTLSFSEGKLELLVFDKEAMIKALGQELYMKISNVTMTDLKKYLSEAEIGKFSMKWRGDSRTLTVVEGAK